MSIPPILEMRDVSLSFGNVRVLDRAHFALQQGEVHALLGENGAGKSSLMKVLFGLYRMTGGEIVRDGSPIGIGSPAAALGHGIAMIHQELPFANHLTVAQNLFLGREPRSGLFRFIDDERMNADAREALRRFPVDVDPRTRMGRLSIAQQQIVAIAKAISTGAEIVVLDEATTALTEYETDRLFGVLEELAREGKTFVMITHRLDEVFRIADRVTVMRDGRTIASFRTADATAAELVRNMVGREVSDVFPDRPAPKPPSRPPRLSVRNLRTRKLCSVTFDLAPGEVLGVAGLMGAGRTSLFNALFGVDALIEGTIAVDGTEVQIKSPRQAIDLGLAYVTEDRKANGLALLRSVQENVTLPVVHRHTRWGFLKKRELEQVSRVYENRLAIDARVRHRTALMSGGNQQKVVLARWLATGANVFLLDEPTRGVDVATKMEVYDLINALTAGGKSVLLVTSELPELMALSDRFLVMAQGAIVCELTRADATPERIVYHASTNPSA